MPMSAARRVPSLRSIAFRLILASRPETAADEVWPDTKLSSFAPFGRVRPVVFLSTAVVSEVAPIAPSSTAPPLSLLVSHSPESSPPGVAISVPSIRTPEVVRRLLLQRSAPAVDPKIGVFSRAQSEVLRSNPLTWKASAPATGAQTQGSRAAAAAAWPMRSQPGLRVASAPQACPDGNVEHPAVSSVPPSTRRPATNFRISAVLDGAPAEDQLLPASDQPHLDPARTDRRDSLGRRRAVG